MTPGAIIEFADRGHFHLAAVLKKEGRKRLHVLRADPDAPPRVTTISIRQATFDFPPPVDPDLPHDALLEQLLALQDAAQPLAQRADTLTLWELLSEQRPGEILPPDALAGLLFQDTQRPHLLATVLALRADDLHFKPRPTGFKARTPHQVETLAAAREAARERQRAREDLIRRVAFALEAEHALDADALDEPAEALLERIERYAIHGDDFAERREADALIDAITEAGDHIHLQGRGSERAFHLLVALGRFHRDEDLALRRNLIPTAFSPELIALAESLRDASPFAPHRRDLSGLRAYTIDDTETLDYDDALSADWLESGDLQIGIHIAAPNHLVPLDSPLELEARRRGTTLYLPTRDITMFPRVLSHDLVSLIEGELRAALSFLVTFDYGHAIVDVEIVPSVIRVNRNLSYERAEHLLEHGEGPDAERLRTLYEVAGSLLTNRIADGAIHLDIPEVKVRVDPRDGRVQVRCFDGRSMTREVVAEYMVLANTLTAEYVADHDIPAFYRYQPDPVAPLDTPDILALPEGPARSLAMRRRLRPANVGMSPERHFALAVDAYTQVTSPIRRYADLLLHYQLDAVLSGQPPALSRDAFSERLTLGDVAAADARQAASESTRYWLLRYLETLRGETIDATVVDYGAGNTVVVILDETQIRTKVTLRRHAELGDSIQLLVEHVHPRNDQLHLRPAP